MGRVSSTAGPGSCGRPWLLAAAVGRRDALRARPARLGVDELGGRLVEFAADATMGLGGAAAWALDTAELAYRGNDPATHVLALVALVVGAFLAGGVLDRYARQRPVDARTFWGCAGELVFRLLRLTIVVAAIALALGWCRGRTRVAWVQPIEIDRGAGPLHRRRLRPRPAGRRAPAERDLRDRRRGALRAAAGRRGRDPLHAARADAGGRPGAIHAVANATDTAVDAGVPVWLGSIQVVAPLTVLIPALVCGAAVDLALPGLARPRRLRGAAPARLARCAGDRDPRRDRRDFPPAV